MAMLGQFLLIPQNLEILCFLQYQPAESVICFWLFVMDGNNFSHSALNVR